VSRNTIGESSGARPNQKLPNAPGSLQILQTHDLVNFVIVQAHSHDGIPISVLLEIHMAAIPRPIKPVQFTAHQLRPLLCPQIEELDDVMIRVTAIM
jgi:hypothetical protein